MQGPIAGTRQAAALIGRKLEIDEEGFIITFHGIFPDMYLCEETESKWKRDVLNIDKSHLDATEGKERIQDKRNRTKRKTLGLSTRWLRPRQRRRSPPTAAEECGHVRSRGLQRSSEAVPQSTLASPEDETDNNLRKDKKKPTKKGRKDLRGVGNAIDTLRNHDPLQEQGCAHP